MRRKVRLITTGLRPTTWNLAASAALAELHRAGLAEDTLRFQHFPRSAILGRHQVLAQEIDLAWCAEQGVEVARRITGGGAIVMAPGILGWELILPASMYAHDLAAAVQRICTAAAAGLSTLGVDARFRPRNDIEVDGRKISGTGGYVDGRSLLYQGTVLIRLDRELLCSALLWPAEKLARHEVATIDQRVTDLLALTGREIGMAEVEAALAAGFAAGLGLDLEPALLTTEEVELTGRLLDEEIGRPAFIEGDSLPAGEGTIEASHRAPGSTIKAIVRLRPGDERIVERVLLHGDYFVAPPRVIADLEAALRDLPLAEAPARASTFLERSGTRFLGCTPNDFAAVLERAHQPQEA